MKNLFLAFAISFSAQFVFAEQVRQEAKDAFRYATDVQEKINELHRGGWQEEGELALVVLSVTGGSGTMTPTFRTVRVQQNFSRGLDTTNVSAVLWNTITAGAQFFHRYSFLFLSKTPQDSSFVVQIERSLWIDEKPSAPDFQTVEAAIQKKAGFYCHPYQAQRQGPSQMAWEQVSDQHPDGTTQFKFYALGNYICSP